MKLRIPFRPREDPLVPDAVKPKTPENPADYWRDIPSPTAKKKPCEFCGGLFLRGCKAAEHANCLNFNTAERRKQRVTK